jgi:hypothetical protein
VRFSTSAMSPVPLKSGFRISDPVRVGQSSTEDRPLALDDNEIQQVSSLIRRALQYDAAERPSAADLL